MIFSIFIAETGKRLFNSQEEHTPFKEKILFQSLFIA